MKALKILVVDDDEAFASIVQHILACEGYDSRTARNAAEAYRIFPVFRPGLVISDLQMPGESGVQLIRQLRKVHDVNFRTIYMSGDLDQFRTDLDEEQTKHSVRRLAKPFTRHDLVRVVFQIERALMARAA
jgi:DNA-binding response OmpR family regulator